jgi:hypothetical protein
MRSYSGLVINIKAEPHKVTLRQNHIKYRVTCVLIRCLATWANLIPCVLEHAKHVPEPYQLEDNFSLVLPYLRILSLPFLLPSSSTSVGTHPWQDCRGKVRSMPTSTRT